MIKENENHEIFQKRNLRKQKAIRIHSAIAKHGILTKYGVKQFRDKMTMEGNHNLLFGTMDGSPVSLCLQSEFTHRNLNVLALEGNTRKGWDNYTLPNLLAAHSSSVVVGNEADIEAAASTLLKKDWDHLYLVQFEGSITDRFDILPLKKSQLYHIAEGYIKLFHEARDEATKGYFGDIQYLAEGIYSSFLKFALLYTRLSEDITDHERTFKTVGNVLKDIQENGVEQIAKYVVPGSEPIVVQISELIMAQIKDAAEYPQLTDMAERMLIALLHDISPLTECQVFEKDENPQMNVSIDKFINEKCCMMIPIPEEEKAKKLMEFYLLIFMDKLCAYRETFTYYEANRAHSDEGRDRTLKNPVCFYLNEFARYKIPWLPNYLAMGRRYDIGFSVIAHSVQEIYSLYPEQDGINDAECLFEAVDTVLAFDVKSDDDYNYLSKLMPVQVHADGKEISEREKKQHKRQAERYAPYTQTIPAYSSEELHRLLNEKVLVTVQDFDSIICDPLPSPRLRKF